MKKPDKKINSKGMVSHLRDPYKKLLDTETAPSIEAQIREQQIRQQLGLGEIEARLNVGRRAVGRLVDPTPDSISFQDDVREVAVKVTEMPDKKHFLINAGCKTAIVHNFHEARFVVARFFREEYKSFFEKEKKK